MKKFTEAEITELKKQANDIYKEVYTSQNKVGGDNA